MADTPDTTGAEYPAQDDARFTSGLPSHWQLNEEAFLRLGGYVEPRPAPPPAKVVAPMPVPATTAAPSPGSAEAFDRIIAELSREEEGADSAREARDAMLNGTADTAISQGDPYGPDDDPVAEAAQYEAQRRLRDANVRLAEAEQLLRALEGQPREPESADLMIEEPRSIVRSILRFLLAVFLLLLLIGTLGGVAVAVWYYYDDVLAFLPVS